MFSFRASLDSGEATLALDKILARNLDPVSFESCLIRLRRLSASAVAHYPPPWPAPGLAITPEINCQSELWLPLAEIRPVFERFFRLSLSYPPILSSTPFASAPSWAAIAASLPFGACCCLPDRLLERLMIDDDFRLKLLCWSFMPKRFYGSGVERYPDQTAWIASWLEEQKGHRKKLRCLDAACGTGFATYGLARHLVEKGWQTEDFTLEGWTLDPLEAWAAAHALFPHDAAVTALCRRELAPLAVCRGLASLTFRVVDLLTASKVKEESFDLILCNGLLGGPIVNLPADLEQITGRLARLLAPGGALLVADHFHGGWKKKCPQNGLRALLKQNGLKLLETVEGIGGVRT